MLSHLRFHRRAPSNPTSPLPDPPPSWEAAALQDRNSTPDDGLPRPDTRPKSSNSASVPPMLPPINRVTSDFEPTFEHIRGDGRPASQDSRQAPSRPAQEDGRLSFFSSATLQNFRRGGQGEHRQESAGNMPRQSQLPENLLSRSKPPPPPINTGFSLRPAPATKQPRTPNSFVTPTDLQHEQQGPLSGKRPTGTRFASEPAPLPSVTTATETQKGKKGLPFLKNPMSTLLMRKRGGQNASATQPLPSVAEPGYAGIRGTRVHDFSAPRPRRAPTPTGPGGISATKDQPSDPERTESRDGLVLEPGARESMPDKARPIPVEKDLPEKPVPPVPSKDGSVASHRTSSSMTSRAGSIGASGVLGSASSVRTIASRNFSMSSSSRRDSTLSALPRHMKSTSSRFSFDMIGAANQEKLLEERHRQREQEKKTTEVGSNVQRDSRFDDFDDENFDYDAMMDDDGLEEAIPGVNADYEEDDGFGGDGFGDDGGFGENQGLDETVDPDNDQENFSGFVFQRSNPTSSIASPRTPGTGMLATPRDTEGKAIGFALTKDTTPEIPFPASPMDLPHSTYPLKPDDDPGLGIQGLSIASDQRLASASAEGELPGRRDDDLYFDGGLADELDFEHDGVAFDESIFDNDDTDQYGRPIPGAFAQAKEAMQAAQQRLSKHDSDPAVRSGASESTAHVSALTGVEQTSTDPDARDESPSLNAGDPQPLSSIPGQDLAYQAALAEAAQKAAALGKFRRSSSPPLPAELTVTSPTDSHVSHLHGDLDASLDDYENDPFSEDIDDFEFDDEAIIAEANASALANDSDGFYGQEFGFYSTPLPTHQGHHSASSSNGSNALSAENLFQYANGGFFGPAGQGLARTTSGRVVSREPNLTPITERSEYSNRNSVMSLTLPPAIGNDGRNSAAGMHSPGLAQLAMLGSDDENMSLSALRKLRNKAWGGSQASLSSREGSPRSERALGPNSDLASSPWNAGPSHLGPAAHGHGRKGSAFSLWNSSEAGESGTGSPTMTVAPLVFPMSPPVPVPPMLPQILSPASQASGPPSAVPGLACSPVLEGEEDAEWQEPRGIDESFSEPPLHSQEIAPPISPEPMTPAQQRRPVMGHRHKGSADSISYTKEEEPESGGTRWVLERRRTAESGEIEILGREVVEGGRI
ncbi:hypothetical protein B0T14DRAFT_527352 [Immersiella caudata]|uniref:AGC-kinase C-terminal domain-containing protein n=1 Tax=Immersiella caudata TaxID=314043 RepID=A0AA40BUC0_9PEZI|nr:hypothetical protein B0T14DRAFT_527352 [Immersiella caudata]